MLNHEFAKGDIVIRRGGKKPAAVAYLPSCKGGQYYCRYLHNNSGFYADPGSLTVYNPEENSMEKSKTLYSFNGEDGTKGLGFHIGTNSKNQYLIEEKDTGRVLIFSKEELEEVVPYTFSATISGKENHYIGKPGMVNKGDILLYTGSNQPQIAIVTGVETKNKSARSKFKGMKLTAEAIE